MYMYRYVNDVAEAVSQVAQSAETLGETYNLAGPDVMTMKEVTEFVFHVMGRNPGVVDLPTTMLRGLGRLVEQFPGPYFTHDKVIQQLSDNIIREEQGETNDLPTLLVRILIM